MPSSTPLFHLRGIGYIVIRERAVVLYFILRKLRQSRDVQERIKRSPEASRMAWININCRVEHVCRKGTALPAIYTNPCHSRPYELMTTSYEWRNPMSSWLINYVRTRITADNPAGKDSPSALADDWSKKLGLREHTSLLRKRYRALEVTPSRIVFSWKIRVVGERAAHSRGLKKIRRPRQNTATVLLGARRYIMVYRAAKREGQRDRALQQFNESEGRKRGFITFGMGLVLEPGLENSDEDLDGLQSDVRSSGDKCAWLYARGARTGQDVVPNAAANLCRLGCHDPFVNLTIAFLEPLRNIAAAGGERKERVGE
ncbi:hypothetical protein C8J57DRAFT_1462993 [Mycena rebaudengoi]|nr:hypothetical protein C8J57DRAFT_1462993 [Mycena rebaudengoi]